MQLISQTNNYVRFSACLPLSAHLHIRIRIHIHRQGQVHKIYMLVLLWKCCVRSFVHYSWSQEHNAFCTTKVGAEKECCVDQLYLLKYVHLASAVTCQGNRVAAWIFSPSHKTWMVTLTLISFFYIWNEQDMFFVHASSHRGYF